VVGFGGWGEFGVLLEVYLEVISWSVFRAFGHGVLGVKDVKVIVVLLWYSFPEFRMSFSDGGKVLLGGMSQGYLVECLGEMVLAVQTPLGYAPLLPVELDLVEATPGESE